MTKQEFAFIRLSETGEDQEIDIRVVDRRQSRREKTKRFVRVVDRRRDEKK